MDLTIPISCVFSAILAAYSAYSATKKAADERDRVQAAAIARLETKVDLLSERVDKHNNLIERTYKLEADVSALHDIVKIGGTE